MEGEGAKIVLAWIFLMATGRVVLHVIFLGMFSFAPENFAQEDFKVFINLSTIPPCLVALTSQSDCVQTNNV